MKLMLKGLGINTTRTVNHITRSQQNGQMVFEPSQSRRELVRFFQELKRQELILRDTSTSSSRSRQNQVMQEVFGFWIEKGPSLIPKAGNGVFLRGGSVGPGKIVAMYPGTLYRPGEAIFLNSIHNRYILKCNDGIYVDGKATGLSGSIYRSLNRRDNYPGIIPTADITWMTDQPRNPLAIGQIVNNGTSQFPSNVRYQELDITTEACPLELQEYLPNIWHAGDWHGEEQSQDTLRTVVLISTRSIEPNQELYSTYIE
ncbi:SET domain-containing protein 9 [Podila epigama]|nr:SET domain-containing protein 9 [Podila epigama]